MLRRISNFKLDRSYVEALTDTFDKVLNIQQRSRDDNLI